MEAFDYPLVKIFQPTVQFRMPLYQRPYVWNKKKQWAPLWEDVKGVADRFLAERGRPTLEGEPGPLERTPPHFLGAVVHAEGGGSHADVDLRLVIDGQQRLTTLQMLLMVVRGQAAALGETKIAAQLERLVENDDAFVSTKAERWKVWPTNIDRVAFVEAFAGGDTSGEGSIFLSARDFFDAAVGAWLADVDEGESPADRVAALGAVLQHRIHVVSIELQTKDNAQAIFETLNDRGEPLLAADLVKNYSFQQAGLDPDELDELYERAWKPFDVDKKWRKEVRQGRLRRPRIDVFLQHWLSLELGRDVGTSDLFSMFKELHTDHGVSAVDLLDRLAAAAAVYDQLDVVADQEPHSADGTFVHRWRRIEASTFTPALLCLFPSDVPEDQRRRGLAAIESYLVRRMLCQWTTKQYNLLAVDLAVRLKDAEPGDRGQMAESFLASQTAESRIWPGDDDVRKALRTKRAYRSIRGDRLVMVLSAIENRLRRAAGSEEYLSHGAKLELEHILPVSWTAYWPLPDDGRIELEAQIERDQALHRIGNLTLTSGRINKELRNYPWSDDQAAALGLEKITDFGVKRHSKQQALRAKSVLRLNAELLERYPEAWDEHSITDRAGWLADQAISIWPRPASPATDQETGPPGR